MKPTQILELEKHLGFELTETKDIDDILNWEKSKTYLLNDAQDVIGLNLCICELRDTSFLKELSQLQTLNLTANQILDISFLQDLKQLQTLNLTVNQISDISFLQNLPNLTSLNLSYNQISDISFLQKLTNLTSLNLGVNQISDISFLQNLPDLMGLNLYENQISDISFLQNLTNLTNLYLGNNQISDISFLQNLTNLTDLDLRNNQILDISFLQKLTNLTELDLRNNQILDISFLQNLTNLTNLDLSKNQISQISFSNGLTNLRKLWLEDNQITNISLENFEHLTNLQVSGNPLKSIALKNFILMKLLDLRHLQIEKIELQNLPNLTSLNLSRNQITNISSLQNLPNLTSLNLSSNHQISDYSFLQNLIYLKELNLSYNQISDISFLQNLPNLTSLFLNENQVFDISFLQNLPNLTSLDLSHNQILDYSFLQNLINLKELNLSSNQISDISFLHNLKNLIKVKIGWNRIIDISHFNHLKNITSLKLQVNGISDISFLQELTNLTSLDLSNNQISDISALQNLENMLYLSVRVNKISTIQTIKKMPNLRDLDVRGNQITDVSLEFLNRFPKLQTLYLYNNPIQNISEQIINKSENVLEDVRNYLEGIAKDDKAGKITYNREMKMILVGNGGVGKAQTANRLADGETFVFNQQHDSTHGIVQKPYRLNDVLFHLWDFAGQEIYHATHRLFLQTRALFVLVWDYETEFEKTHHEHDKVLYKNEKLDYWLQYIQCFGKDSQILLVQNKINIHPKHELHSKDIKILQAKYPILEVVRVSAETGEGFDELEYYLEDIIKNNPVLIKHFQQRIVSAWASVRQEIREQREKGEKLMSKDDFIALCAKYEDEKSVSTILSYLHDTGEVYYQANYFGGNIILNQDWAIQAIYQVLDRTETHSKIIKTKKGKMDYAIICKVWKENTDNERNLFIDFMLSAELCFEVTKYENDLKNRIFVIPQLLSEKNAEIIYEISKINAVYTEKIKYPFLPTVFMDRFIVNASQLSAENYMWSGGILLDTNKGKAIVEADYAQKHISIIAESLELLKTIQKVLERITQEGKIKNDKDSFEETQKMWEIFEKNKIFKNKTNIKSNMNENIKNALSALENANIAGYFDEMNKVEMPDNFKPIYAQHKKIFITGHNSFDFHEKLEVFAKNVDKSISHTQPQNPNNMSNSTDNQKDQDGKIVINFNPIITNTQTQTNNQTQNNTQTFDFKGFESALPNFQSMLAVLKEDLERASKKEPENKDIKEALEITETTIESTEKVEQIAEKKDEKEIKKAGLWTRLGNFGKWLVGNAKEVLSADTIKGIGKSASQIDKFGKSIGIETGFNFDSFGSE